MNILDLGPYAGLVISLFTAAALIKSNLTSGEKELSARTAKAESKLVEYDRRIQAIEAELKHLPDRNTTHRLELSLSEIAGRLNTIEAAQAGRFHTMEQKLAPIEAMSERLNDILMDKATKL